MAVRCNSISHRKACRSSLFTSIRYGPRKLPLGYREEALSIVPFKTGNAVWEIPDKTVGECAAALPAGVKVGSSGGFESKRGLLWGSGGSAYSVVTHCDWQFRSHGAFLGLKFIFDGQTHYGWAHVAVTHTTATIEGYAYESVPNQTIFTGKTSGPESAALFEPTPLPAPHPAGLGALALGADGLQTWRKAGRCAEDNQSLARAPIT